jgi:hypothetical protein
MQTLIRIAAVIALLSASFLAVSVALTLTTDSGLPACQTEDSTNCYWDSALHGNGTGVRFIDFHGIAYYAPTE